MKLFLDFDGTLTTKDVGNEFFRAFGGDRCLDLVKAYRDGRISAQECFRGEVEAMGTIAPDAAEQFLCSIEMRSGLETLLATCIREHIEVCVLSDGLDFYIRSILDRAGVTQVPFFANVLFLPPDGDEAVVPSIEFPFENGECDHCACCKRNIMLGRAHERDVVIYVGDGFSDQCPVQYADVVFARGELQTFCREHNVSHYTFHTLDDVRLRLEELVARRRIRKRHRADVRRREAYIAEA